MHKCVHFKENHPEKANAEKYRENSLGDGQKWAVADHYQSQGITHRRKIL